MNKKKLAPLRAKNDVTHALQLKLHERMNKKQIWSGCDVIWSNKNRDDENQEKVNNSPSYRCAAINKKKLSQMDENTAQNSSICANLFSNSSQSQKVIHWTQCVNKKLHSLRKS